MSLQANMQQPCMPCTKSELELESILPLQIGMVYDNLVQTGPKSGSEGGGPLEFHQIPTSNDDYLELSLCYLYLECGSWRPMGCLLRPPRIANPWACEPAVPLPLQTSSTGDKQRSGGDERGCLPVQGLPYHAAQLWLPGQGNLQAT